MLARRLGWGSMAKEAEKANNIYAWGADCYPPLSGDIGPTIFWPPEWT